MRSRGIHGSLYFHPKMGSSSPARKGWVLQGDTIGSHQPPTLWMLSTLTVFVTAFVFLFDWAYYSTFCDGCQVVLGKFIKINLRAGTKPPLNPNLKSPPSKRWAWVSVKEKSVFLLHGHSGSHGAENGGGGEADYGAATALGSLSGCLSGGFGGGLGRLLGGCLGRLLGRCLSGLLGGCLGLLGVAVSFSTVR